MTTQRSILLGALVLCAIVIPSSIPLPWFTAGGLTSTTGDALDPITLTGEHGTLTVFWPLPIWLLCLLSAMASLLVATNLVSLTRIPLWILMNALGIPGVCFALPLLLARPYFHVRVGLIVALISTTVALLICWTTRKFAVAGDEVRHDSTK